jgi:hypothetical protein
MERLPLAYQSFFLTGELPGDLKGRNHLSIVMDAVTLDACLKVPWIDYS